MLRSHDLIETMAAEARRLISGLLVALAEVAAATLFLCLLRNYFELDHAHVGLVYILVVASTAAAAGTCPALFAALTSFLTWNFFFLRPFYRFELEDSRDWILLFAFFVIALLVGHITGRLRLREEESRARERETAALYTSSLAVGTLTTLEEALPVLMRQIMRSLVADGCAVVRDIDGRTQIVASEGNTGRLENNGAATLVHYVCRELHAVGLGPRPSQPGPDETAWPVSIDACSVLGHETTSRDVLLPLTHGGHALGALYVACAGDATPRTAVEDRLLVVFASHAATCLERYRLLEEARAAASQQETERLKTVLFSSLSHNLKTPLASLNATVSSLRGNDVEWDALSWRDSLEMINEDLERLTEHIENLLSLAQLESGHWTPQREWIELREVFFMALRTLPQKDQCRVCLDFASDPFLYVDAVQISQVVRHLLENALVYSPPQSHVYVGAHRSATEVRFWVDDAGDGIGTAEVERVFRKFYRGEAAMRKSVRGTGLGLSICREIIAVHHGNIGIARSPVGGARVWVVLPALPCDAPSPPRREVSLLVQG